MGLVSMRNTKWVVMVQSEVGQGWAWVGEGTGEGSGGVGRAVKTLFILALSPSLATSFCVALGQWLPLSGPLFLYL